MSTEDPPDIDEEEETNAEGDNQEDPNGEEMVEQEVETQPAPTETVPQTQQERTPSDQWEAFATYSITENGVTYKIIPQFTATETVWTLWAFGSGQGPLQYPNGIPDNVAEAFGLSQRTQQDLNATLQKAQQEMELPTEFRGQPRRRKGLGELKETLDVE